MRAACEHTYGVWVVPDLLRPERDELADAVGPRRALVVTTPTVASLYGGRLRDYVAARGLDVVVQVVAMSETTKTLTTASEICRTALDVGVGRRGPLVAFGGGVCIDVVAVAAGLLRRGTPRVNLPTTLLAQVDAGIGIKGAVNFEGRKNVLGCYEPPTAVLMDPGWVRTTRQRELRSGTAEIMKMALVRDFDLFDQLSRHAGELLDSSFTRPAGLPGRVIGRAIDLMLEELEPNAFETVTLERLVDFGHTVSGLLEERSAFAVRHGEAVAVDMALSTAYAEAVGLMSAADATLVLDTFCRLGLPVWHDLLTPDAVDAAVRHTTHHRDGNVNWVVPVAVGKATVVGPPSAIDPSGVGQALTSLARRHADRHGAAAHPS